jgi:glycosyltransferase involved in cell wall biosynthesis
VRVLEVLPTYPGDLFDGSAVYERNLNRALLERNVHVEVLSTRSQKLQHERYFSIRWPDELPVHDEHDGVPIHRFHALDTGRVGDAASDAVARRWSWEDFAEGSVVSGSAAFTEVAVAQARRRPKRFDLLADVGRGPLVPGLLAHLVRRASRYDVILAGYAPFSLSRQVLWAASRSGVPVVLLPFIHESDRYHHFNSLLRTYEQAAAVLTLSHHTSDFLQTFVPRANPVTLGAGVTSRAPSRTSKAEFRLRHEIGDRPIILYVGRKERSKRYDLAVRAVEMLEGEAVLVMVGRDADGKAVDSDLVRQLGTVTAEELAAAYQACDVFVLPSEFESFGMVFLDAWSHAKPVIGNAKCGATAALIDDGVDGFLCRDAGEIAAAIRRLIEDPELTARMGAAGRAKTLADFTWDRVAGRAIRAFEEVAGRGQLRSSTLSRSENGKGSLVGIGS